MAEQSMLEAASLKSWRKSSYSNDQGGSCLEVLDNHPSGVPVRDSKNPHGPVLVIPALPWTAFLTAIKVGHLGRHG